MRLMGISRATSTRRRCSLSVTAAARSSRLSPRPVAIEASRLLLQGQFPESAKLITTDGVRVELEDGWGVVRSSHTIPALMFRFEAESPEAMERIQGLFRQQLSTLAPDLQLPF